MEIVNNDGHPATLVAAHPTNTNAVKSGVYSRSGRILSSRAAEIAEAIMFVPYVREPDKFAAAEVGRLIALIEDGPRDRHERSHSARRQED
jgi:hypothetical protein